MPPNPFDAVFAPPTTEQPQAAAPQANPFASILEPNAPPVAAEPQGAPALKDVPGLAAKNFLPSLGQKASDIYHAATGDPWKFLTSVVESMPNIYDTGIRMDPRGHGIQFETPSMVKYGIDLFHNMIDKYGSWDKAKTTVANDPDGFLMDLMSFIPGLGTEAKATSIAGKVAQGAKAAIDPSKALSVARNVAGVGSDIAGKAADLWVQGLEGIGEGALRTVFESGQKVTPGVWKTLTHGIDWNKSEGLIHQAWDNLMDQRGAAYDLEMSKLEQAGTKLTPQTFQNIDDAMNRAAAVGTYKPQGTNVTYNYGNTDPQLQNARGMMMAEWQKYKMLPPEFHTAFGLDKFKQLLYDISRRSDMMDPKGMPSRGSAFASTFAGQVADEIKTLAPDYAATMNKWQADTNQMRSLQKEFALNSDNRNQTLRAMQKVWRQSADVAQGQRTNMLNDAMTKAGVPNLLENLAAEQFHPGLPRGLRGAFYAPEVFAAIGHAAVEPFTGGLHLATMPFRSPRVTGVTAYGLGRVSGSPFGRGLYDAYRGAEYGVPAAARAQRWGAPPPSQEQQPEEPHARGGYLSRRKRR